jgi:UDP-N-acetylmuramoylalanine--D-glutamate ligase
VVGGGKSGFAALRFLKKIGAEVSLSDAGIKHEKQPEFIDWLEKEKIKCEFGGHRSKTFLDKDLIVVSPGVSLSIPEIVAARSKGVSVIGEFGLASCFIDIPIIAVTGTNGKTTVTEMVGEMFRAAEMRVFVGGNIGTPLTECLLSEEKADVAVLEVSSFQLETADCFKPKVGVLLNITPDHLDRYKSFEEYGDTKFKMFHNQQQEDAVVLNCDDQEIMSRVEVLAGRGRKYFFGRALNGRPGVEKRNDTVALTSSALGKEEVYTLPESMRLSPVRENCMAAILAARLMGCSQQGIRQGLARFHRLPHRVSFVAEINNVAYYDDSKATNIGAVQSALQGMTRPVILIAGGRDKGGDYGLLSEIVGKKVRKILLIGEAREKMASVLGGIVDAEMCQSLEEAVKHAAEVAKPGDAVLLSPACASFDMFKSYEERGQHFQKAVKELMVN